MKKYDENYPLMDQVREFLENRKKIGSRFFTQIDPDQGSES